MKKYITVFVEGRLPIKVQITELTTVDDVVEKLGIIGKMISSTWTSKNKIKPETPIYGRTTLITKSRGSYPKFEEKLILEDSVLWIGFYPRKNETKYGYKWVGNEKPTMTKEDFHKEFSKLARYMRDTNSYEIRGIKAATPGELSKRYQESKDLILI